MPPIWEGRSEIRSSFASSEVMAYREQLLFTSVKDIEVSSLYSLIEAMALLSADRASILAVDRSLSFVAAFLFVIEVTAKSRAMIDINARNPIASITAKPLSFPLLYSAFMIDLFVLQQLNAELPLYINYIRIYCKK